MYTSLIPKGIPSNSPMVSPRAILASTLAAKSNAVTSNKELTVLWVFLAKPVSFSCTNAVQLISLDSSCLCIFLICDSILVFYNFSNDQIPVFFFGKIFSDDFLFQIRTFFHHIRS